MVNYKKLGYGNIDEYNLDFLDTLLKTNRTYDFFVDWNKIFDKLEKNVVEINILNSLSKISPNNIEDKFREILTKYPECVPLLPLILAIRDKNIEVFDAEKKTSKNINFSIGRFEIDEVITFSKNTGLLNLFTEIDDLYSYLTGTEVGLDTNARKNRSGHIFEGIVKEFLEETIKSKPDYILKVEDSSISLGRVKRFDFVLYKDKKPKFLFECNFYNSTGSKPIETANAYIDLQHKIETTDMTFIWITDGIGWKKMFSTLKSASKSIEYVLNFNMLKNKIDSIL
ncbi:type II restriction endonuclease [Methanobrevibacter curvatus]|uniref:Type-2 restriction enzyme n=1 Tax=Methanobrevibacter curvatus TaxID=49547 RepID=A0A162FGS0_9EURY|nr:type II restriction endonuclease [Methanobrevibacter curvatus]KZX12805.1 type-2 restriction enzyme MboI [Methanobrevibacter curvatus]